MGKPEEMGAEKERRGSSGKMQASDEYYATRGHSGSIVLVRP
jgi:hypothetical protein